MGEIVLKVCNISKNYAKSVALNDLSFQIEEGMIFGLIGANGAGKSSVLKVICGLAKMDFGDVYISGYSLKKNFEKAVANLGGIIERPELYENMTGLGNLQYFASLHKNVTQKRIDEVVDIVGLKGKIKDKVKTYSLGMKMRLGIAQAILHRPKLIILDEPTNALDSEGIITIRQLLKKLAIKDKVAVLISSHNLFEMEQTCDKIAILKSGAIEKIYVVEQKKLSREKISIKVDFPNYAGKLILQKFGEVPLSVLKNTITLEMAQDKIPEITALLVESGLNIYSICSVKQSLEDVFLDTINKKTLPLKVKRRNNV